MSWSDRLRSLSTHPSWRYAIVGGVVSIPVTIAMSWPTLRSMEFAVILPGLFAGFLAHDRVEDVGLVGRRAGAIGGLPVLIVVADLVLLAATWDGTPWFALAWTVAILLFSALTIAASAAFGHLFALVGNWVAREFDLPRPTLGRT